MRFFLPTVLSAATSLTLLLAGAPASAQMQHKDSTSNHGQMTQQMGQHRAEHRADHRAERQAHRAEHRAERQQKLKAALQLTPTQEAAWSTYVQAQQRPQRATPPDRQAWTHMTTPQRLDQMLARKGERDTHMTQMINATRGLYAVLDAEQQKVFDSMAPTAGMGRGAMPHHGAHGMNHGG